MNRREFLKGGLGGVFGALLAWAGVVRAEEVASPSNDIEIVEVKVTPPGTWDPGLLFSQNGKLSLDRVREARRKEYYAWTGREWSVVLPPGLSPTLALPGMGVHPSDSYAIQGAIRGGGAPGFSHWIHWATDGSDEDGTGTAEDPVATEACAQAIAGNPHRWATAAMLTHDGITGAILDRDGSALVSDDMGATWREMDSAQVQEWADLG